MIAGYTVYVIFHFPINAFLFKALETSLQKTIARYFAIIIITTGIIYYFIVASIVQIDYKSLLLLIWFYIFTLLAVKSVLIFGRKSGIITKEIIPDKL